MSMPPFAGAIRAARCILPNGRNNCRDLEGIQADQQQAAEIIDREVGKLMAALEECRNQLALWEKAVGFDQESEAARKKAEAAITEWKEGE